MSDLDRFVLGLIIAMVVILAMIAIFACVGRWMDRRDLREYERRAEARLTDYEREKKKRLHAEGRAELIERLRKDRRQ